MGKRTWTDEEINYLKSVYSYGNLNDICNTLNKTEEAIRLKANRLGLKRENIIKPSRRHPDIDLTGQRFGGLTVVEWSYDKYDIYHRGLWKCICDCQLDKPEEEWEYTYASTGNLKSGNIISCGCWNREVASKNCIERCKKYNDYYVLNNTVFIKFSNCERYFLCDLDDWAKFKEYCWSCDKKGYAVTQINGKTIKMHRLIMNTPDGLVTDHIYQVSNGVCDNRKNNLQIKTQQENSWNSVKSKNNTSGYTGVSICGDKYRARIIVNGKEFFLGYYDTAEEAAEVYKKAKNVYHKEYTDYSVGEVAKI